MTFISFPYKEGESISLGTPIVTGSYITHNRHNPSYYIAAIGLSFGYKATVGQSRSITYAIPFWMPRTFSLYKF